MSYPYRPRRPDVPITWEPPRGSGVQHEESRVEALRRLIEEQYADHPTGCGASFGEILCYEIHGAGMTFAWLAQKWSISLPTLGELIFDHCKRLEELPKVNHAWGKK